MQVPVCVRARIPGACLESVVALYQYVARLNTSGIILNERSTVGLAFTWIMDTN